MPRIRAALACAALSFAASIGVDARGAPPPPKDWELEIAPYGWLALAHGQVDTARFGKQDFTIDAHEVLKSFDLGGMAAINARWHRFVFLSDFVWAKLSTDGDIGDGLVAYDVTQKLGWYEALAGYRVVSRPGGLFGTPTADDPRTFGIDLMGGLTYSWTKLELDLSRDPLGQIPANERTLRAKRDAVAPYLAIRFHNDFTPRLRHETLGGVGSFGVGDAAHVSWQVTSLFSWAFSEHWIGTAGYRALGVRYPDLHLTFHGPILGMGYRF